MAGVNEKRTSDVIRVLKIPRAGLSQNACGERTKKYFVAISVPQSAQCINSERKYPHIRVSSSPGLVSVARVNK